MKEIKSKALLALLFVGVLMGALDLAIIGPALPAIQAEFGMNDRQLSVLFNAYVLAQLVGTPLLAKLSDRFGPRAIYVASIAIFAAGSAMLAFVGEMTTLYYGRAIQGFGAGGVFPAAAAVIGAELPPDKRGPALGVLGTVFGIAFLIGPAIGGILLQFSWQWLFLVNLPIAALLITGAFRLLPQAGETRHRAFDLAGIVTLAVALSALVLAINNLDTGDVPGSLLSPGVGGFALACIVLLSVFWRIELRAADPIVRPVFFQSRQIVRACTIAMGAGAVQAAGVFYPALAVAALEVTKSEAAWLMLPNYAAATIASPAAGYLINFIGTRAVIASGLTLVLGGLLVYGFADFGVIGFVAAGIISGTGMAGLVGAPLRFILLTESAPADRASSQGLLNVFGSVGRLLGAALVGSVAASAGGGEAGYQSGFVVMAALIAVMLVVAALLKSRASEQDAVKAVPQPGHV